MWGNEGLDLQNCSATYSCVGTGSTAGEGNVTEDPLFLDPEEGDYNLQLGSPCIDTGKNDGAPATNIDEHPRPWDGDSDTIDTVDMGVI